MKKVLILIALITLPVLSFGQNEPQGVLKQNDIITMASITLQQITEQPRTLITFSKNDVVNLSYKKSNDLISITAYRKSLQIRTREVKSC